jgi:integrase
MASIRCRKDTGLLFLDFRYGGKRCREHTLLTDTPVNRTRLQKLADKIERAINQGTFVYAEFFPDSPRAKAQAMPDANGQPVLATAIASGLQGAPNPVPTPTFSEFAELWILESAPRWRKQYSETMRDTLDRIINPYFGVKRLAEITRADVLGFRAEIAKRKGRAGESLSGKRINKLMSILKAILTEGCDRFGLNSPGRGIKPLKQKRADIHPFSMDEVERLIATVREDYRPYLTVRMLTGIRTGEADGLQWIDINLEANVFKITRTVSRNGDGDPKTEASRREIAMVPQVRAAFEEQKKRALDGCPWVFHTLHGNTIDAVNFANRVWYPLLRHLGLKQRPPYQMRHTAATLMLAAGENPEWVASVLGHTTTEMLFRVYSRFVPNLTRNDGRAFTGLLTDLTSLSRDQLEAMVRSMTTSNAKESHHVS